MKAEDLLEELDSCHGPCGELCVSCPEAHYLKEIRDVLEELIRERNMYRQLCELVDDRTNLKNLCEKYGLEIRLG